MIRRMLLAVALVAAAVVALPATAHAQYPTSCGFILDPPVIATDGQVTVVGSGFGAGFRATFYIAPTDRPDARVVLGSAVSDDDLDGNLRATFPLPAGFNVDGEFLITVECPEGDIASNVLIVGLGAPTTLAPAQPSQVRTLPVTGSDLPVTLARVGVVALVLGGIVLLATRRQRARTSV